MRGEKEMLCEIIFQNRAFQLSTLKLCQFKHLHNLIPGLSGVCIGLCDAVGLLMTPLRNNFIHIQITLLTCGNVGLKLLHAIYGTIF